ncbi:hypothetical protein Vafri_13324 [Volvox africanus]|nr:hypothetical protein Vafri_13324 [Volvox africanus]
MLPSATILFVVILIESALGQGIPVWPQYNCSNSPPVSYTLNDSESLYLTSLQFKVSISQLMLDNQLSHKNKLVSGQPLTINCPDGFWSPPFGVMDYTLKMWYGMAALPTVLRCPPSEYAVSFFAEVNRDWYSWLGTLTMRCNGGRNYTIDAQPNKKLRVVDVEKSLTTGVRTISLTATWAIESLFGVGSGTGGSQSVFTCPSGTVITGFSAGAYPPMYETVPPNSWIMNLQFLCQERSLPPSPPIPSRPPLPPPSPHPPPTPGSRPELPVFPDFDCSNSRAVKYVSSAVDNLYNVADTFSTSISQVMFDNDLDHRTPLYDGQELIINCPVGKWTMPYGKYNNSDLEVWFGMSAAASLWLCPPGEYAVEFSVTSNRIWYSWLGALTMRCNGGGVYTADAQPSSPYYGVDGVTSRPEGFKSGTVEADSDGASLLSVFDLGPLAGTATPATFQCPLGAMIKGFSAGAYPLRYDVIEPNSWLMNLQFLCQGPAPPPLPSPPPHPPIAPSSPPEAPSTDAPPPSQLNYSSYFCGNSSLAYGSATTDAALAQNFSISSVRAGLSAGSFISTLTSMFANDKLQGPLHGVIGANGPAPLIEHVLTFISDSSLNPSRVVAVGACCVRSEDSVSSTGNGGVQRILFRMLDGSVRSLGNGTLCSGPGGFESVPPGYQFAGFETRTAAAGTNGASGVEQLRFLFVMRPGTPPRLRPPPPYAYNGTVYGETRSRCKGIHCLNTDRASAVGILIAIVCGGLFLCGMIILASMWMRRKKRRVIQYLIAASGNPPDLRGAAQSAVNQVRRFVRLSAKFAANGLSSVALVYNNRMHAAHRQATPIHTSDISSLMRDSPFSKLFENPLSEVETDGIRRHHGSMALRTRSRSSFREGMISSYFSLQDSCACPPSAHSSKELALSRPTRLTSADKPQPVPSPDDSPPSSVPHDSSQITPSSPCQLKDVTRLSTSPDSDSNPQTSSIAPDRPRRLSALSNSSHPSELPSDRPSSSLLSDGQRVAPQQGHMDADKPPAGPELAVSIAPAVESPDSVSPSAPQPPTMQTPSSTGQGVKAATMESAEESESVGNTAASPSSLQLQSSPPKPALKSTSTNKATPSRPIPPTLGLSKPRALTAPGEAKLGALRPASPHTTTQSAPPHSKAEPSGAASLAAKRPGEKNVSLKQTPSVPLPPAAPARLPAERSIPQRTTTKVPSKLKLSTSKSSTPPTALTSTTAHEVGALSSHPSCAQPTFSAASASEQQGVAAQPASPPLASSTPDARRPTSSEARRPSALQRIAATLMNPLLAQLTAAATTNSARPLPLSEATALPPQVSTKGTGKGAMPWFWRNPSKSQFR